MSNGTLIPHTPISVDYWRVRHCPNAQVFFLTHLHGDHISGLTPTWSRPIYCTGITKKLLVHKLQIREELIHPLATNESHTVWLDEAHHEMMTVTVIDAHHCPGSAMFLFQGYFGTILHTGDFRYSDKMFIDTPLSQSHTVDVLYLDNTYSSPECEFPTRRQAMEQVFEILDRYPEHEVLVGMRSLGKEDLLVAMALHVRTWIVVTSEQYKQLSILDMPNVFTTDPGAGHIHVIPMKQANKYTLEKWNRQRPTIAIVPSALYNGSANPYEGAENLFFVPYSDHSSYSELHRFVEKVRPKKIIPVVDAKTKGPFGEDLSGRADMSCYKKHLDPQEIPSFKIPRSVEAFMKKTHLEVEKGRKKKRKRKAVHGLLANKRRGSITRGVEFNEDDMEHDQPSSTPKTKDSVIYQDAKLSGQCEKSPKLRLKKKVHKWHLIPISIPVEQQESVWKTIGDPRWYFENRMNDRNVEENCMAVERNEQEEGAMKETIDTDRQLDVRFRLNRESNAVTDPSHPLDHVSTEEKGCAPDGKTSERSHETKQSEKSHETKAREKSHKTKPSEKLHETKPGEKSHETKPSEKSHEAKPSEKSHEAKPSEKSHEAKPSENSHGTKPSENSHGTKPRERSHGTKPREKSHETKPREKSHETKPREKSHETKPRERSHGTKPREKSHGTMPREKSHETKPSKKSHEAKPGEKSHETKPSDKSHETKPSNKSHETKPSEKSHETKHSEKSHKTEHSEKSHKTKHSEKSKKRHKTIKRDRNSSNMPTSSSEPLHIQSGAICHKVDHAAQGLDDLERANQSQKVPACVESIFKESNFETRMVAADDTKSPTEKPADIPNQPANSSNFNRKSMVESCPVNPTITPMPNQLSPSTLLGPKFSDLAPNSAEITVPIFQTDQTSEIHIQDEASVCFVNTEETEMSFQKPPLTTQTTEGFIPLPSIEQDVLKFLQEDPSIMQTSVDVCLADNQNVAFHTDIVSDDLTFAIPEQVESEHQEEIPQLFNLNQVTGPSVFTGNGMSQEASTSYGITESTAEVANSAHINVERADSTGGGHHALNTVYTIDINELNSLLLSQQVPCEDQVSSVDNTTEGEEQTITLTLDGTTAEGDTTNTIPGSFIVDPDIVAQGPEAVSQEINRLASELLEKINEALQNPNENISGVDLDSFIPSDDLSYGTTQAEPSTSGENEKLQGDLHQSNRPRTHVISTDDGDKKYFLWGPTSGCSSWQMRGKKRRYDPTRILLSENVDLPGGLALAGTASCGAKSQEGDEKFGLKGRKKRKGWPKGKPRGPRKDSFINVNTQVGSDKQIQLVIKLGKKPLTLLQGKRFRDLRMQGRDSNDKGMEKRTGQPDSKTGDTMTSDFKSIFELLAEVCPSWSTATDLPPSPENTSPFTLSDGWPFQVTANTNDSEISNLETPQNFDLRMAPEMVSDEGEALNVEYDADAPCLNHQIGEAKRHESESVATIKTCLQEEPHSFDSDLGNQICLDTGSATACQSGDDGTREGVQQDALCEDTLEGFCTLPLTDLGCSILGTAGSNLTESNNVHTAEPGSVHDSNKRLSEESQHNDRVEERRMLQMSQETVEVTRNTLQNQVPSASEGRSDNEQLQAAEVSTGRNNVSASSIDGMPSNADDGEVDEAGSPAESVISNGDSSDEDGWLTCDETPDATSRQPTSQVEAILPEVGSIQEPSAEEKHESLPMDCISPSSRSLSNLPPETESSLAEKKSSRKKTLEAPNKFQNTECTHSDTSSQPKEMSHDSTCASKIFSDEEELDILKDGTEKSCAKIDQEKVSNDKVHGQSTCASEIHSDEEEKLDCEKRSGESCAKGDQDKVPYNMVSRKSTFPSDKGEEVEDVEKGKEETGPKRDKEKLSPDEVNKTSIPSDCSHATDMDKNGKRKLPPGTDKNQKKHKRCEDEMEIKQTEHFTRVVNRGDKGDGQTQDGNSVHEQKSNMEESSDEGERVSIPGNISSIPCSELEIEVSNKRNDSEKETEEIPTDSEAGYATSDKKSCDPRSDTEMEINEERSNRDTRYDQENETGEDKEDYPCPEKTIMPCDSCHDAEMERHENEVENYIEETNKDDSRSDRRRETSDSIRFREQDTPVQPDSTSSPKGNAEHALSQDVNYATEGNEDRELSQIDARSSSGDNVQVQSQNNSGIFDIAQQQCPNTSTASESSNIIHSSDQVSMCQYSRPPGRMSDQSSVANKPAKRQIQYPSIVPQNKRRVLGLSISRVITTSVGNSDSDESENSDSDDVICIGEGIECVSKGRDGFITVSHDTSHNEDLDINKNDVITIEPANRTPSHQSAQSNVITIEPEHTSGPDLDHQDIISIDPDHPPDPHQGSENITSVDPKDPTEIDQTGHTGVITVQPNTDHSDLDQDIQGNIISVEPTHSDQDIRNSNNDTAGNDAENEGHEELQIFEIVPEYPNVIIEPPKTGIEDCQPIVIGPVLTEKTSCASSTPSNDSVKAGSLKQSSILSYLSTIKDKKDETHTPQPPEDKQPSPRQTAKKRVASSCKMSSVKKKTDQELIQLAVRKEAERRLKAKMSSEKTKTDQDLIRLAVRKEAERRLKAKMSSEKTKTDQELIRLAVRKEAERRLKAKMSPEKTKTDQELIRLAIKKEAERRLKAKRHQASEAKASDPTVDSPKSKHKEHNASSSAATINKHQVPEKLTKGSSDPGNGNKSSLNSTRTSESDSAGIEPRSCNQEAEWLSTMKITQSCTHTMTSEKTTNSAEELPTDVPNARKETDPSEETRSLNKFSSIDPCNTSIETKTKHHIALNQTQTSSSSKQRKGNHNNSAETSGERESRNIEPSGESSIELGSHQDKTEWASGALKEAQSSSLPNQSVRSQVYPTKSSCDGDSKSLKPKPKPRPEARSRQDKMACLNPGVSTKSAAIMPAVNKSPHISSSTPTETNNKHPVALKQAENRSPDQSNRYHVKTTTATGEGHRKNMEPSTNVSTEVSCHQDKTSKSAEDTLVNLPSKPSHVNSGQNTVIVTNTKQQPPLKEIQGNPLPNPGTKGPIHPTHTSCETEQRSVKPSVEPNILRGKVIILHEKEFTESPADTEISSLCEMSYGQPNSPRTETNHQHQVALKPAQDSSQLVRNPKGSLQNKIVSLNPNRFTKPVEMHPGSVKKALYLGPYNRNKPYMERSNLIKCSPSFSQPRDRFGKFIKLNNGPRRNMASPENRPMRRPAISTKRIMKTKGTFLVTEKRRPKDKINVVLTDGQSLDVLGATPRHVTQFQPFDENIFQAGGRQDQMASKQPGVQPSSTT